jgi:DNA-binding transcriptional MerR regulator
LTLTQRQVLPLSGRIKISNMEVTYSVQQLAKLSGVSIRTLHLYDEMGLLKPHIRTDARYRLYREAELLRLQQILFYKELDFPLKEIQQILDEPGFDLIEALKSHQKGLQARKKRLNVLLKTIDNTLQTLQNKTMLNLDELYNGLSREESAAYRKEAIAAYGNEVVEKAEKHLKTLDKQALQVLVARQKDLARQLALLKDEDPQAAKVQELVHAHYENTRQLWGTADALDKQADAYEGLGKLYLADERFTQVDGKSDPEFREFLSLAMTYYADQHLR